MMSVALLLFLAPLLSCCTAEIKPLDCSDVLKQHPDSASGVYDIFAFTKRFPIQVYCDMETDKGRWTVFQRRMDGSLNFYRGWDQYVTGFGDADGEHWLGLEILHRMTAKRPQELLVEMEDFEGNKASARYSSFSVGGECDGYRLAVSGFTDGGAGDSFTNHNGMKFSTHNNDNDGISNSNCPKWCFGGWWYNKCFKTNPNGIYRYGADATIQHLGVEWTSWKGSNYSLKSISFKIRPVEAVKAGGTEE